MVRLKLVIIFLICNSFCSVANSEDSTILTSTDEGLDTITVDTLDILKRIKNEHYETKQLNNETSSVTNTVNNYASRIPCACLKGQCGCCTGALLASFNQKACLNITYEPDEFAFNAALSLNGRVFYKNTISGKNPPPICIRVPRIRAIRLCVRLSNIYFTGRNMHTCVGMEASWEDFTIFETSFDCFRIGSAGVAIVPPEEGGGISTNTDEDDDSDEDYDDSARGIINK